MLSEQFSLGEEFPPVSYDQWRAMVERELEGVPFDKKLVTHTYEGIDVQPVYTARDDPRRGELPGFFPFTRGPWPLGAVADGWDLRQEYAHPDPELTNQAILADLAGGTRSLLLRFDQAARIGLDADDPAAVDKSGRDGLMLYALTDLARLLDGVSLHGIGIQLQAGAAFIPAAAALVAYWRKQSVSLLDARGAFGADPLEALASEGQLPLSLDSAFEMLADLAVWTGQHLPQCTAVGVNTAVYHDAGATAAQDIAFALATGAEYLRAMTARGMSMEEAARQFLFSFNLGTHHFLALAKLRAARRLWARVIEACGGPESAGAMRIHARTSDRVLTRRDPYVNLLRNTVAMFAAGLGGADAVTSVPFDSLHGPPAEFSRRIARNTLLVLQEEGHLNRTVDPAGGSWFLEQLTQQLAETAWSSFQQVERQGGMRAALTSGWIAAQIDSAFAPRAKDIAFRKDGITGVSEFPDVTESPLSHDAPDTHTLRNLATKRLASSRRGSDPVLKPRDFEDVVSAVDDGATLGQIARALGFHAGTTTIAPIEAHNFAESFEELRDASDRWQHQRGHRPRVFLVPMGPVAHYTARVTYSKNFFEAGGFDTIVGDGFAAADDAAKAFAKSGAAIAIICSSDKLYPEIVPQVAPRLKAAGARTVVLAGNPLDHEAAWRAAGVDRFIYIKCNVLATLRELLAEEGVLAP
jgi:methylmalonyl-CoA mutase